MPKATKNTLALSSMPNHKITSGTKARCGMLRSICKVVSSKVRSKGDKPVATPKVKPTTPPTNKPAAARAALMPKCPHNSPLVSKPQPACTTAHGEEMLRKYCSGKSCQVDTACQASNNKAGSSQGNTTCTTRVCNRFTGRLCVFAKPVNKVCFDSAMMLSP